jgi:hypothetical protein
MVPGPLATAILKSVTMQLQQNNKLFAGKSLILGKFGDELMKQLAQTTTQQQQNIATSTGARPMAFIPATADPAAASASKGATSKRSSKKRRSGETGGTSLLPSASKH